MNKEKFPEYREKVFQYIQEELIPKYDVLSSCIMHRLPEYMNDDVEYIFKLSYDLTDKSKYNLKKSLEIDLADFCDSFNSFYFVRIIIIFI